MKSLTNKGITIQICLIMLAMLPLSSSILLNDAKEQLETIITEYNKIPLINEGPLETISKELIQLKEQAIKDMEELNNPNTLPQVIKAKKCNDSDINLCTNSAKEFVSKMLFFIERFETVTTQNNKKILPHLADLVLKFKKEVITNNLNSEVRSMRSSLIIGVLGIKTKANDLMRMLQTHLKDRIWPRGNVPNEISFSSRAISNILPWYIELNNKFKIVDKNVYKTFEKNFEQVFLHETFNARTINEKKFTNILDKVDEIKDLIVVQYDYFYSQKYDIAEKLNELSGLVDIFESVLNVHYELTDQVQQDSMKKIQTKETQFKEINDFRKVHKDYQDYIDNFKEYRPWTYRNDIIGTLRQYEKYLEENKQIGNSNEFTWYTEIKKRKNRRRRFR